MSFIPPGEIGREAIGGHEVEADLVTRDYARMHPEADRPRIKRPHKLLARLLGALKRGGAPKSE